MLMFRLILLSTLLLTSFGCSKIGILKDLKLPGISVRKIEGADYSKEIKRLEILSASHRKKEVRINTHLQLALLHASHKNPKQNYKKALKELKIFLSFSKGSLFTYDAKNFFIILKNLDKIKEEVVFLEGINKHLVSTNGKLIKNTNEIIEDYNGLIKEYDKLTDVNFKLSGSKKKLSGQVDKLSTQIEMLKSIEVDHAKKRKIYKNIGKK